MLAAIVGACSSTTTASTSSAAATTAVPGTTDGADGPTYVVQAGGHVDHDRRRLRRDRPADRRCQRLVRRHRSRHPAGSDDPPTLRRRAASGRPRPSPRRHRDRRPPHRPPPRRAPRSAAAITTSAAASGYEPVATPRGPEFSAPIDASWVQPDGTLIGIADGQYWATAERVAGDSVEFRLGQAFFDGTHAARGSPRCRTGVRTASTSSPSPTGTITMSPGVADVIVCDFLAFPPGECYRVTGAEFTRLVGGARPAPGLRPTSSTHRRRSSSPSVTVP